MEQLRCAICGKELSGGLDTYGDPDQPLCFEDFFTPIDQPDGLPWQDDIDTTEGFLEELRFDLSMAYDDDLDPYQRLELEVDIRTNESLLAQYRHWQADSLLRIKKAADQRLAAWKKLAQ